MGELNTTSSHRQKWCILDKLKCSFQMLAVCEDPFATFVFFYLFTLHRTDKGGAFGEAVAYLWPFFFSSFHLFPPPSTDRRWCICGSGNVSFASFFSSFLGAKSHFNVSFASFFSLFFGGPNLTFTDSIKLVTFKDKMITAPLAPTKWCILDSSQWLTDIPRRYINKVH